jgi:hypothetical protein
MVGIIRVMTDLSKDKRRCLRALREKPLYSSAVGLILGGILANPDKTFSKVTKDGLVKFSDQAWSLTDQGRAELQRTDTG